MTLIKFKNDNGERRVERMPYFSEFFNDIFDNMLTSDWRRNTLPAVNVIESDDQFMLELAAPGLKKEDFKIKVDKDILSVSAEKQEEKKEEKNKYTRREFNFVSFSRTFTLPEMVNADQISAHYENGIMSVTLPKREEAKPRPAREVKIA